MLEHVPAITAAVIWSYSVLIYKDFSIKTDAVIINIWRLLSAMLFLLILYFIFSDKVISVGILYASISGILTLGFGDSLYFYSCVYASASIATPIIYTYIIFIQLTASLYGEYLTISKIFASILAFIGIFLLARKKDENIDVDRKIRLKGIIYAIIAMFLWVGGQTILKPAVAEANTIDVTLYRTIAGLITLLIISSFFKIKIVKLDRLGQFKLHIFGILDIGVGTLLYVFSISLIGLGKTVILTSLMPLLTQFFAVATHREKISFLEVASAILIIIAVIICIIY